MPATYRLNDCAFIFHVGRDLDQPITFNNTGEPRVKLPVLKSNAELADGDSLGFELKLVCSQD